MESVPRLAHSVALSVFLCASPALAEEPIPCPDGAYCETIPAAEPEEDYFEDTVEPAAEPTEVEEEASPVLASEDRNWAPNGGYPAQELPPYEKDEHPVQRAGGLIFAASYVLPFFVGLGGALIVEEVPEALGVIPLMLPVAGPPLTAAIYDGSEAVWGLMGVTAGVQAVGLIILAIGAGMDASEPDSAAKTIEPTGSGFVIRF